MRLPSPLSLPIPLILAIPTSLCILFGSILVFVRYITSRPFRHHTATVLVLGDIGRSPRMMYHTESLARHGYHTSLIGYDDTPPIPSLQESPHVHLHPIANPPRLLLAVLPWVVRAPLRVVYQAWSVLKITLWDVPVHTEVMLVQNPPSIPTLALAQLICWVTGSKLIIDWHNTGCSILALRLGDKSPLVRLAEAFEAKFGRRAHAHLFVTRALKDHLLNIWHLEGRTAVLHDRPPSHFSRTLPMDRDALRQKVAPTLIPPVPSTFRRGVSSDPVALLVSSTSWTADEDFTPLLQALDAYQLARDGGKPLPKVLCIITGKGSLRSSLEAAVAEREGRGEKGWRDVCVRCTFLPAREYPLLLGSADLGISVHSSSSGLDLPMKVVDMFGCGTPVLAKGYPAIGELVKEGVNGRKWTNPGELGQQLIETLSEYPESTELTKLRKHFEPKTGPRRQRTILADMDLEEEDDWASWDDNWDRVMHRGVLQQ